MATAGATVSSRHTWLSWLVGALVGLLVFLAPLTILEAVAEDPPEIRFTPTGDRFSALVASGDQSILVINSNRADEATSALGRLRRPWEPRPQTIVAPSADDAAAGVLQAAALLTPERVIIAGLPGADPAWSRLERLCRDEGIELVFAADYLRIEAGDIAISILTSHSQEGNEPELVISGNGLHVALGLGVQPPSTPAHIAVVNGTAAPDSTGSSVIIQSSWMHQENDVGTRLLANRQEVVTILVEENKLRVRGGQVIARPDLDGKAG